MSDALMNTYGQRPLTFVRGKGCWLYDDKDIAYLDALSGIAVCGLGHAHPAVTKAISAQAAAVVHTSNLYNIPLQQQLAEKLCAISGMDKVFFGNSGAEANEAAIKLARMYGHHRNIDNPAIIVMEKSFHGRTLATLSATGNRKVQAGFEPLVQGFVRARYDAIDDIELIAKNNPNVVAILVEPIQGEGGVRLPADDYLQKLRAICDQQQWLLMLDEVQTGNGRTGKYFAFQHTPITPDVVTTAKGLANGVPIGACLARGIAATLFGPGNHGSTYGGNPLACAAALAALDTLITEQLIDRAEISGRKLQTMFRHELENCAVVREIRGKGMMLGIELNKSCGDIVKLAAQQHLLVNVTADNVIRLLPPLIISDSEIDTLVSTLCDIIRKF